MTATTLTTTAAAVLLATASAFADDRSPGDIGPGSLTPAAELSDFMKAFEGNWNCDTRLASGAVGPGSREIAVKSTVKIKKDLNGFWYQGTYEIKRSKGTPGFRGIFFVGYDTGSRMAVLTSLDDTGSLATLHGTLQGDSVTLTGDGTMMGTKVKSRETLAKKGDKVSYHKYEVDLGKGFQLMGEDTCRK